MFSVGVWVGKKYKGRAGCAIYDGAALVFHFLASCKIEVFSGAARGFEVFCGAARGC